MIVESLKITEIKLNRSLNSRAGEMANFLTALALAPDFFSRGSGS